MLLNYLSIVLKRKYTIIHILSSLYNCHTPLPYCMSCTPPLLCVLHPSPSVCNCVDHIIMLYNSLIITLPQYHTHLPTKILCGNSEFDKYNKRTENLLKIIHNSEMRQFNSECDKYNKRTKNLLKIIHKFSIFYITSISININERNNWHNIYK